MSDVGLEHITWSENKSQQSSGKTHPLYLRFTQPSPQEDRYLVVTEWKLNREENSSLPNYMLVICYCNKLLSQMFLLSLPQLPQNNLNTVSLLQVLSICLLGFCHLLGHQI